MFERFSSTFSDYLYIFIHLVFTGDCFVHYRYIWTVFYWFFYGFCSLFYIYITVSRVLPLAISYFDIPSACLKVVFAFYSRSTCPIGLEFFVCTSGGAPDLNLVFGRVFPLATADWLVANRGLRFAYLIATAVLTDLIVYSNYFCTGYGFRTLLFIWLGCLCSELDLCL